MYHQNEQFFPKELISIYYLLGTNLLYSQKKQKAIEKCGHLFLQSGYTAVTKVTRIYFLKLKRNAVINFQLNFNRFCSDMKNLKILLVKS